MLLVIRLSSGSFSCPEQEESLSVQPRTCPLFILSSTGNMTVLLRAALGGLLSDHPYSELPVRLGRHRLQSDIALVMLLSKIHSA